MYDDSHLDGLSTVHKKLVVSYGKSIMSGWRELEHVRPVSLIRYVEIEIAKRKAMQVN